jgi:hypothetical protein
MPTLDAPPLWRPLPPGDGSGTDTDWPILATVALTIDTDGPVERPTSNEAFHFDTAPDVESDAARVRRAVHRAVDTFGPAFDRLGSE